MLRCAYRNVNDNERQEGAWLNDELCNFYLGMLQERELKRNPIKPKVFFFNTFFYAKLYANTGRYDFEGVSKWVSKLKYSILECETLVVPIHKDRYHWTSVVIQVKDVSLDYLDSAGGDDNKALVRAHVCAGWFLVCRVARSFYRTFVLAPYLAPRYPSWASAEADNWTYGTGLSRMHTYPCRKSSSSSSSTSMRPKRSRYSRGGRRRGAVP